MLKKLKRYKLWIAVVWLLVFCFKAKAQESVTAIRERISLNGIWTFRADVSNAGRKNNWQDSVFKDEVRLPGSFEENEKGILVTDASPAYLNQTRKFQGAVWYQKEITIPHSWKDKHVQLFLERTKVTQVWIDGMHIGSSTLLSAPQVFDLGAPLSPGKHLLTVLVDNSPKLVSVGGSHALSEHTQTNWNGIIGRMFFEASDQLRIKSLRIKPDIKKGLAMVQVHLFNSNPSDRKLILELNAVSRNSNKEHQVKPLQFKLRMQGRDTVLSLAYPLGAEALLWNEYTPSLYKLRIQLRDKKRIIDETSDNFGLREFKPSGTQFAINDVITFLRGKNDGCIFPLTGYPPMDTASWRRMYRIAKSYGINHYRFHSYTPPEAAFTAADMEGIYIQSELPNWANLAVKDTFQTNFQYREGKAIMDAYGNHPSFVLFSLGNELAGDQVVHNKLVKDMQKYDGGRRLYAHGTNAFYADPKPGETDDFWVTMRTGKESPQREFDVRGSFATSEDVENGILNAAEPSTRRDFSSALKNVQIPVVGHETGQFQIYPDYREISKYTGILKPLNFGIFKKRLADAGMGDQATSFFRASGKLTALLYREEIEMALRTPGFAGFQLLDLQDYPGQGTALVGLLNAFMENKGLITADEFRRFNNDVVIQLLMDKYTWKNNEAFHADVQLVNYSNRDLADKKLHWVVLTEDNSEVAKGTLNVNAVKGKISSVDKIRFSLGGITKASKLLIKLHMDSYSIEYPAWIYPDALPIKDRRNIQLATMLDQKVINELNRGGKVLLFPDHNAIKSNSVPAQFISEFWNWKVFKGLAESLKRPVSAGTLGILTNPQHALFTDFPTEFHTNWQWWWITKNTRPLILDQTDKEYRPIVQVIDNIDRNHKLGMIFEFRAGKGKLLVCMADLPALSARPEAKQLYFSILNYMDSDKFDPQTAIGLIRLKQLLSNTTN